MGRGVGEDEGEDGEGMRMMWMIWMMRIRMLGSQSHRMRWNEVGWGEMGRVYAGIKWDGQCIQYLPLGAMIGLIGRPQGRASTYVGGTVEASEEQVARFGSEQ